MGNSRDDCCSITFYVSNEGNDLWSGRFAEPNSDETDGPFATIARARDAIRELKSSGRLTSPVNVRIRGGTYRLTEPLVFTPEDSGTKECPISYSACCGEQPVISGGREIVGEWRQYEGGIMVCTIDEVKRGEWFFRQLFANGKRQMRARIPREDNFFIDGVVDQSSFKYKEGEFRRWKNLTDVEIVLFHSWNESRLIVSELDEENRIVRCLDPKARHPLGWGGAGGPNRYYIENILEGVREPGDWYLDKHTGELYYFPIDEIDKLELIAPVLPELLRLDGGEKGDGVEHIVFEGITFAHTSWSLPEQGYPDCGDVGDIVHPSAITFENAHHCVFRNNRVMNIGTYALEITGSDNLVTDNEISDIGGGGIISRNYDEEPNRICYNHIHHCGEVYPSAVGINIDDGGGIISHNLIHDIAHSGVYARHWPTENQPQERENQEQQLLIEYNEIYNVMTKINDGGGVFVRDSNIVIRNNLIHDVYSYSNRCPGWGIYLGCETRDTLVENNIVYGTRESVHVWHYDRNVEMVNNIFVDGEISQINYQNPQHLSHENIKFLRNIICYSGEKSLLFRLSGERSLPAESDYNVYYRPDGGELINSGVPELRTFAQWQARGFDVHSVVADPMFVDPENGDYSLKPDSPAFKLGFREIDMSEVGLRGREKK